MSDRAAIRLEDGPCPGQFYAFDAPYPDGECHNGHLDDGDGDGCLEYDNYKPCPHCNNDEYLTGLRDGAEITPPYGFGKLIDGDYFALSHREMLELEDSIR